MLVNLPLMRDGLSHSPSCDPASHAHAGMHENSPDKAASLGRLFSFQYPEDAIRINRKGSVVRIFIRGVECIDTANSESQGVAKRL